MVEWQTRFRASATIRAEIASADPTRGLLVSDRDGVLQAYAWEVDTGNVRAVTGDEAATTEATVSHDGSTIVFLVEDEPGREIGHVHAVPFEGGEATDLTPELPSYSLFQVAERNGVVFGLVGIDGGTAVLLIHGDQVTTFGLDSMPTAVDLDPESGIIVLTETRPGRGLGTRVRAMSIESGETLGVLDHAGMGVVHGEDIAVGVTEGEWTRPALWRVGSEPERIALDTPGDVFPITWSADGSRLLLSQEYRARGGLLLLHLELGRVDPLAGPPGGRPPWWASPSSLIEADRALSVWSDARTPWRPVISSADDWHVPNIGAVETFEGSAWEEVTFSATDGTELQGWLLRPPGDGPWPTILHTHGGPTSVQQATFNPTAQAWVDHGYALLSVNYRGSTTFGESFREALSGSVGVTDVGDVVAAHRWLIESGTAIPSRIIKNGYSWGGYLTLQVLGTHPDLWAAGIAGAPVADFAEGFEIQNDYMRAYDVALFGGSPTDVPDRYRVASPITHVDAITAPLLVSHPENDSRTPLPPVQRFVDELAARGGTVELHVMPAGHMGAGDDHAIEMMERWLAFADHLPVDRATDAPN